MPAPRPVPPELGAGPFTARYAAGLGVSERVLRGKRFRRVHPRVWVHAAHAMTFADEVEAARLALPEGSHVDGETRHRLLGYDAGSARPLEFVIDEDQHRDLLGVFLHRTVLLPPLDGTGVTPAAAFIRCCERQRLIDLVKRGDWLLHRGHMTREELVSLATAQSWRPGAAQALRVAAMLDGRARSPKESELRVLVIGCGLPTPEVNVDLVVRGRWLGCVDLLLRAWLLVLEYEGRQHAEDMTQFTRDIGRYAGLRDHDVEYRQITDAMLGRPRALMLMVHEKLRERGYDGPPPDFGASWRALFARVPAPRRVARS
ncbi:hypothetical protein FE697_007420 [Mumia zhuanghuii]|uniref:Uncharacterized protein n=2 Tax=Mumia TaxID=1546255 RepID=A0ABW1QNL0_9ACTN|nr:MULTISPECIES: hypothetical protein [Mumia]KAA1423430.1 hypothetical protein FE697_007420 [Mumia zhuanghuii]